MGSGSGDGSSGDGDGDGSAVDKYLGNHLGGGGQRVFQKQLGSIENTEA